MLFSFSFFRIFKISTAAIGAQRPTVNYAMQSLNGQKKNRKKEERNENPFIYKSLVSVLGCVENTFHLHMLNYTKSL